MKIKFLKDKFGYKAGDVAELEAVEASDFIAKGLAEKVDESADALDKVVADFEAKVNTAVEKAATDAATKVVEKIAKGVAKPRIVVGNDNVEGDPQAGFKSFGEFAAEVVKFSTGRATSENFQRYVKSTTGNTSGAAPDAGPTVPVAYASNIFKVSGGQPDLLSMAFQVPMTTGSVKVPVLKNYNKANTTAANGVTANVIAEAAAITQSRSNWEQISLSLSKLAVLVPVSDELLEDNIVALDSVLNEHAAYQIRKACNAGIVSGNSAFTGVIDHAATKVVNRDTADTVKFVDVLAMYAAFAHDDADYQNAVWLVNPTVLPQLGNMTSGNQNIYTPAGVAGNPFATLLGRPIIVTGHAKALGTAGDVLLVDLKKYLAGMKGGINAASSMHLFFNTDETAFRYTLRVNGKPGLTGPITLEDGATTVSPFVQLDDPAA